MESSSHRWTGVLAALFSAFLFGASTPFAKQVLPGTNPALMAGLLYLGSGIGLGAYWIFRSVCRRSARTARLNRKDAFWLAGAFFSGGVIGPILLLIGLRESAASTASLLLNLEGVLTALLAWVVFKENFDSRVVTGMALIAAGGMVLAWTGRPAAGLPMGSAAIVCACLAWAVDNNLTRKVSGGDAVQIAMLKGLVAGSVNTLAGLLMGTSLPHMASLVGIGLIGLFGYGVSLVLFVIALRHLGTARTGAYFSTAPFVGAIIAVAFFGDHLSPPLLVAGLMMGAGVWLHLAERHEHLHRHELMEHEHLHHHDAHHQHAHEPGDPPGEPHSHRHRHEELVHSHPHYPDIHHQHSH